MKTLRFVLALTAAALPLGLLPLAAHAEDSTYSAGPHVDSGLSLRIDGNGTFGTFGTFTYAVEAAGAEPVTAYCLDLQAQYRPGSGLRETSWADAPAAAAYGPQITWLLNHSYPALSLEQVAPELAFRDGLSTGEAVAATQAAIWHYTNGTAIDADDVVGSADQRNDVTALYSFLTGPQNVGASGIPTDVLSLAANGGAGHAGERIGPIALTTSIPATLELDDAPDGVALVDADGAAVTGPAGTTDLYLEVPENAEPGTVTITASSTATTASARVFLPVLGDPESATQPLVAATTRTHTLAATITLNWADAPALQTSAIDDADGDKLVLPGGTVRDIVNYDGLTPGETYTIVGELIDVATGAQTGATGFTTLTPTTPSGFVEVEIPLSAHAEPGTALVVFENAYDLDANLIASHADLTSRDQSITVDMPIEPAEPTQPTEPTEPTLPTQPAQSPAPPQDTSDVLPVADATAPEQQLADTGADAMQWGLLGGSALVLGAGALLLARRVR